MLIYLYGPDAYRRQKKLHEILAQFAKKNPAFTLSHFELIDDAALTAYTAFLAMRSLFREKKVGVIHEIDTDCKGMLPALKSPLPADTTIILSLPQKLPKPYAFLENTPSVTQAFEAPEGNELRAFIKKEAAARELSLTPEQALALAAEWQSNTWGIVTELDALALGRKAATPISRPDFFPLIQRLKGGTLRDRLTALAFILEYEEPAAAFNVLASLTSGSTKQKMADYDVAIKSGKLEYEEVLTDFVLSTH